MRLEGRLTKYMATLPTLARWQASKGRSMAEGADDDPPRCRQNSLYDTTSIRRRADCRRGAVSIPARSRTAASCPSKRSAGISIKDSGGEGYFPLAME